MLEAVKRNAADFLGSYQRLFLKRGKRKGAERVGGRKVKRGGGGKEWEREKRKKAASLDQHPDANPSHHESRLKVPSRGASGRERPEEWGAE